MNVYDWSGHMTTTSWICTWLHLPFIPMIGARENAKEAALYLGEKRWFQDLGAYPWHYFNFFIPSIVLSHVSASWNTYLWSCPIPTYSNTSSQPHVSQDCRGFHLLIMATLSVLGKASCSQHWENTILQVERFPLRIIVCGEQWGQPMKINKFIIYSETSPF